MKIKIFISLFILISLASFQSEAQRVNRSSGGGGGNRPAARPATPSAGSNRSINGGSVKSPDRVQQKPANISKPNSDSNSRPNAGNDNKTDVRNNKAGGDKNIGNNNKVNIDNSKKNVNVNIDNSKDVRVNNSRNTSVRRNTNYRPYPRQPYRYGGYRYNCYHPYVYHPYRPFYWGPVWHPWGFFIATLAVTAVVISVESQQYHYDQGVYYVPSNGGYTVVAAPVGATIVTLPEGSQTIDNSNSNNTTVVNNYYYGGTYYEKTTGGYTVVPPTAGMVVESLPEGGEEVKIGDVTYVKVGETYYQPINQDGKEVYEVVDVQKDA
jgi:hypothetical protein